MANVIQLRNTGNAGFTRMDNQLLDALASHDFTITERKVIDVVLRLTAGYQRQEARITGREFEARTGKKRNHVSEALDALLRRNVLYRVGGSSGEIGIRNPSDWTEKQATAKSGQCPKIGTDKVREFGHHIKKKEITTPDGVVSAPTTQQVVELPAKATRPAKAKATGFTLSNLLADNPHCVSEQVLADWLTCRSKLRAAVTATVWKRVNAELAKCAAFGISADDALAEAQEAGWRGFKAEWLINRQRSNAPAKRSAGPDFHSDDISWANDLGPL